MTSFRRVTPLRLSILAAVVTLAFSQIVLGLIAGNVEEFPEEARFHLGILVWVWALPILVLLAVDLVLVPDDAAEGRAAHGWRLALYTLTAFSFARQLQVQYWPGSFDRFDNASRLVSIGALAVLVWVLLLGRQIRLHRYFGVLGILALLLVGRYAWVVGLGGPAWRVSGVPEERMLRGDPARPPVFVLLFDELSFDVVAGPDGRPDRARYPRLAALADEGRWFVDATTNSAHTPHAMHLMLTGAPPVRDGKAEPPLFFEFLPEGYVGEALSGCPPMDRWIRNRQAGNPRFVQRNQAAFYVPGFFELPGRVARGLAALPFFEGPGFEEGDFDKPAEWVHRNDRWNLEMAALLAATRSERARGRVLFLHSTIPHFPFQYDEQGRPHGHDATSFFVAHPAEVLRNYRRQAQSVDRMVGGFVDALQETGLYDDAILVITSDHGLRSWSNRRNIPVNDLLARIPLLIKAPRLTPGVIQADYQHVDFLPTLLELIEAKPLASTSGVSALSAARPARQKWIECSEVIWHRDPITGAWTR